MYIRICALLTLFLVAFCTSMHAQYNTPRNNVWIFGKRAGLNFSSGSPVAFESSMPDKFFEGSASVCDVSGNLLFYTDGRVVFNRAGHIMLNGDSLTFFQTNSTTNGTEIVPDPGNSDRYYIFSLEQGEPSWVTNGRLAYSVVDMTMDSGFGGVVPTARGIMIDSLLTEKMVSVRGSNCNIWVLTHTQAANEFHAFSVSSSGVSAAVVSATGTLTSYGSYMAGGMNASHDGHTLATTTSTVGAGLGVGVELHDLNLATGIVSNTRIISTKRCYTMEFSPDDSKLYLAEILSSSASLVQFDISLPTTAAITASKTTLATGLWLSTSLKLGRDGKIYTNGTISSVLNRINYPNLAGTACGYVASAVSLTPTTSVQIGLPMTFMNLEVSVTGGGAVCPGGTITLTPSLAGGTWASSNSSVATVSSSGVVTGISAGSALVTYTYSGCAAVASIAVVTSPSAIGGTKTACVGDGAVLSSATGGGSWSSNAPSIAPIAASGIYSGVSSGTAVISYSLSGSCPPATTTVNIISALPPITSSRSEICVGDTLHLSDAVGGGTWLSSSVAQMTVSSNGVASGVSVGTATITYTLGLGCRATKTLTVSTPPNAGVLSGVDTVCVGDTILLSSTVTGGAWSVVGTNVSVSSIGSVVGVNAGTGFISYAVTNSCGTDTSFYTVTVFPASHCIPDTSGTDTTAYVDINLNLKNDIRIFPSYSSGTISVESVKHIAEAQIVVSDVMGKVVLQSTLSGNKTILHMHDLTNGTYLVRVRSGADVVVERIVLLK